MALPVDENFRGGSINSRKFPRGSIVMEPRQQVFPRGLRKIVNFRRGSTKISEGVLQRISEGVFQKTVSENQ